MGPGLKNVQNRARRGSQRMSPGFMKTIIETLRFPDNYGHCGDPKILTIVQLILQR